MLDELPIELLNLICDQIDTPLFEWIKILWKSEFRFLITHTYLMSQRCLELT